SASTGSAVRRHSQVTVHQGCFLFHLATPETCGACVRYSAGRGRANRAASLSVFPGGWEE
ncbi:hypothetical protein P7K49_035817, partial [Saguinus oedipus]